MGQAVAGRGVLEQITSSAIAIREGALVYVIVAAPRVADSAGSAPASEMPGGGEAVSR